MASRDRFRPAGQDELGPAGRIGRIKANLEAIRVLRVIQDEHRPAAPGEQATLARWSGWGAVPQIFDERKDEFAGYRTQLRALLTEDEYAAARRTTLNAHYTDAAVVRAVWDAVSDLGFADGAVLEPGCGSGNFIGFAPPTAQLLGIELDPVTAGIAAALYPDAEIRSESFADTRVPAGGFDLAIGNVPFSSAILTDDRHNASRHSMHNHFILKSLDAVRPGGLVAVLTSRYTMDSVSDGARRDMTEKADLVTAVRLPSGAHRRAAGTDAVTDLLILRRREDGRPPAGTDWAESNPAEFEGGTARVNEYFLAHPENVLGDLDVGGGQYNSEELIVRPRDLGRVPDDLAERLAVAVADAHEHDLAMSPRASWHAAASVRPGGGQVSLRIPSRDAGRFEGTITAHGDGTFTVLHDAEAEPWPCPGSQAAELRSLLRLRDTVCSLLDAERASAEDTPRLADLRARLNREYDAYLNQYGPLNRMAWRRTGRTDESGNETWARQAPAQGKFRQDPHAAIVYALEDFDSESGIASKAPVFSERVIKDRQPADSAETPADAIAICMDADGQVRLERAAALLGSPSQEEARAALGELVYDEPGTGRLIPAAEYLSGKVRAKLGQAEEAAETDPRFAVNAAALRRVLPADLGPGEIDARLGASWIPPELVQQGLQEILEDRTLTAVKGHGTTWKVSGNTHSIAARDVYGTADKDAVALAQCVLEQRPIKVTYSMDDLTAAEKQQLSSARGKDDMAAFVRARAAAATVAARAKADELSDRFAEWLWEDPQRSAGLARIYNEKFNSLVLRSYDDVRPRLPGLAEWFRPHPHQYAAVARIINEPAALLAHEVGAGKTAEMAMGCMELRRLGLASKPAIVVPNHMLEQFQREFLQLYPQARVLACGMKDLQKDRRHAFTARIATGDWDAVIMSRSVFERIPVSAAEQERYIKAKLAAYDEWLEKAAAESEDQRMVKRMENQRLSFEERLKRKLSRTKDAGVSWEQTGIDYLCIDEAHGYKNRDTRSNSPALDIDGSGRAADLEMKLDHLRRENGQRIVTFATATPIANSMTEAYVMLSYLRPDLLADAGIEDFDGWAGSFASTVSDVEVAPEGGIRVKERVARFRNLPELLLMWRVVADVKTGQDLNLPVPELVGGKPEVVTIPPSQELRGFMMSLASRANDVRLQKVPPKEDNMLKISSDGRAAALDLRLTGRPAPDEDGKLDTAAARIAQIYRSTKDSTYTDRDGNPEPATGSLQIVFCELGTPTGSSKFGVYEYLKGQLADRGVPADQIRFMHEARNDRDKANLFAAARAGKISVLIGTTELMGVGTNVQKRAVALHHLDCPWRPADVAQREGRILRQGNQNSRVQVIRYVTEGSFDAYMWQTVTRKAKFIAQIMHGRLDSREIEDIGGSEALSYSEVTALATGDMRILAKAKADAEVQRLGKLESSWRRTKRHLKMRISDGQRDIPRLKDQAARLQAAISRRTEMKGDAFHCSLNGKPITKRADAADELQSSLEPIYRQATVANRDGEAASATPLGTFGGFALEGTGHIDNFGVYADLRFPDIPSGSIRVRPVNSQLGIVTKLENKLSSLDAVLAETHQGLAATEQEVERARETLGAPFAKAGELARARSEADRLGAELGGRKPPAEPEAHETPVTDAAAEAADEDDETSPDNDESWDNDDFDADRDENPLDVPATGQAPEEWQDELDEQSPEAEADDTAAAAAADASSSTHALQDDGEPEHEPTGTPSEEAVSPEAAETTVTASVLQTEAPAKPALPAGTEPVASHRAWGGPVRPGRLVYQDGTELAVWRPNDEGDEVIVHAVAAGSKVTSASGGYGGGHLQVVQWEDGSHGVVHPARTCPRNVDPYAGLSDRDRARWETFDRYESYGESIAYLPARLIRVGDALQLKRGTPNHPADLTNIWAVVSNHSDPDASIHLTVPGHKQGLQVPPDRQMAVGVPEVHPTLDASITAITGERPGRDSADEDEQGENTASPPIRIVQDDEGTRVYGTDRSQSDVTRTLKAHGFKWSRRHGFWYLNRSWKPETRRSRAEAAHNALDQLGVAHEMVRPAPEATPEAQPAEEPDPAETRVVQEPSLTTGPVMRQSPEEAQGFEQESLFGLSEPDAAEDEPSPVVDDQEQGVRVSADSGTSSKIEVREDQPEAAATVSAPAEGPAAAAVPLASLTNVTIGNPQPYEGSRAQAESGSMWIEKDYQAWLRTHEQAGEARLPAEHPRVVQLTRAWRAIRAKGLADGPGPSAIRYHTLAHSAIALAATTDPANDYGEIEALNLLASHARKHSIRLRATAEHIFSQGHKSGRYTNGRADADKGSRIIDSDYRSWARSGVPAEAARDPLLWQQARRAELAWHAIRRAGLTDGPAPAATRYRELADATRALADGFTANLPSHALHHLLDLAEHADRHATRLHATAQLRKPTDRTSQNQQHTDRAPSPPGNSHQFPSDHLAAVTQQARATQPAASQPPEDSNDEQAAARRNLTRQRESTARGNSR